MPRGATLLLLGPLCLQLALVVLDRTGAWERSPIVRAETLVAFLLTLGALVVRLGLDARSSAQDAPPADRSTW